MKRSESFNESNLVKVYAPPNLHSVMPGNQVMLRSGGPRMTVYDVAANGDALVSYVDDEGRLHRGQFKLLCLTCYGAK